MSVAFTPRASRLAVLHRCRGDQSGSVAIVFSLMVVPMTAFAGLAVDFGRMYHVSSHTQIALDGSVLAAGRVAQIETSDTMNKASSAATAYFNQAKPKNVALSTLQFSPSSTQTEFTVTATSWVKTPFLSALKFLYIKDSDPEAPTGCQGNFFSCMKLTSTAKAELKAGGDGSNVEVALMLDVTGSMCSPCSKIDALKPAAKDLIDIVIWNDQSRYTSKVALAPFAGGEFDGVILTSNAFGGAHAAMLLTHD